MKKQLLFLGLLFIGFIQIIDAQVDHFKKHNPCTFSIELPITMKLSKMYSDSSPDYCDYEVKLNDGFVIMELHSLIIGRFDIDNSGIKGLFNKAIKSTEINITYKIQRSNWFVISGTKENGNIVYWKRVVGANFVSDLHIEYPTKRKAQIEKYIASIAESFKSE